MNYADVVRLSRTNDHQLCLVRSQAETELGRLMQKDEESLLFARFKPKLICNQIEKVTMFFFLMLLIFLSVWIWRFEILVDAL